MCTNFFISYTQGEVSIEELSPKRPLEVFMCSAKKKQGYEEGVKQCL